MLIRNPATKIQKLNASIVDFNHPQFITILGKLLSPVYKPAFNINAPIDEAGTTLLSVAISNGNTKAIHELRNADADKTGMDTDKLNAALIAAVRNGENQLMDQLLELGAEPHHRIEKTGISTLHVAAMYGNVDAIKKLLSLHLSPFNHDAHGDTPLSIAVKRNDIEAVKAFIDSIINKHHHANQLLKQLNFNRQLEYLLNSAQSAEVMTEICRLISYLDQRGIRHNEIAKLVKSPLVAAKVKPYPYMVDREKNYYANLEANNLTSYDDFLQPYYQRTNVTSPLSLAIESNNLMTVKMLLLVTPLYLADFDEFKNKHQLLVQLDKDYPVIVNSLLNRELQRLNRYIKDNDIASVNSIYDLAMINPDARRASLLKHMKFHHHFRDAILAAKDSRMCLALLRMIDMLEQNGRIDHHDLLPEKYTFANYHLKEDIFGAIKQLPLAERIKKYNAILNDKDSAYYHIFHMKRGYIWGVSENRGILHDIREAYYTTRNAIECNQHRQHNQMHLNDRLYRATLENNLEKMRRRIKQGADVNYKNTYAKILYPIHVASHYGFTDAVSVLIENGVNVNMVAQDGPRGICGVSALGYAASTGNADVVDLLLSKGANTEIARRFDDGTALMLAIDKANLKIVKSLLNHQAKIDTFGNASLKFKSPLDLAVRDKSQEILNTLVDHMIKHYEINRIVIFLQTHDTLKTCFNQAGKNSQLLAPLQKLLKHLVANNVPSDVLEALLPESMKTSKKKLETTAETATTGLYPEINQNIVQYPVATQQYLEKGGQLRTETAPPAYVVENPFTGNPLPQAAAAAVSDPFAAIDAILKAPAPAKACVNPFTEWVEREKQAVAKKPGYKNPFDDLTDEQHDAQVAAQLDALPKAPSGGVFFAVQKVSQSNTDESGKKRIAALN